MWRGEWLALERDGARGEYGVASVHDAVAVVDEYVRHVCAASAQGEGHAPCGLAQEVLATEVEEFGRGAP